jgi:hypothetical protein
LKVEEQLMSTDKSIIDIDDAVSSRRAEAARRNGAQSRGPKTGERKLRSSQNSLKYGMHARTLVLPGESEEDYHQLRDEYLDHFAPSGPAEKHEVETLYNSEWRIRRMRRIEVAEVKYQMEKEGGKHNDLGVAIGYRLDLDEGGAGGVPSVYRYEPKLQGDYDRALRRILDLQERRAGNPLLPAIENRQNEPKPLPFDLTADQWPLTADQPLTTAPPDPSCIRQTPHVIRQVAVVVPISGHARHQNLRVSQVHLNLVQRRLASGCAA